MPIACGLGLRVANMWPNLGRVGRYGTQAKTARALLKFCEDHGYAPGGLKDLRTCVKALEYGRLDEALAAFKRIPLGGMGTFGDWTPPAAFASETPEYAERVFDALLSRWMHLMALLEQESAPRE